MTNTNINIVVVEDNDLLREEMVSFLTRPGWQAHGVDCGEELNRWLTQHTPHIAVLDVNLPYEDGYSIASRLRARYPNIAIALFTTCVEVLDYVEGYRRGADVCLNKPVSDDELEAVVENFARRVRCHLPSIYRLNSQTMTLDAPEGQQCILTKNEWRVLEMMASSSSHLTPKILLQKELDMTADHLAVVFSRLRARCKSHLGLQNLLTAERGQGYRLLVPMVLEK